MATIMLTLHGFLLTSWILIHPPLLLLLSSHVVGDKTTLMLASSSGGVDNGDIFAVSSGAVRQQQQQQSVEVSFPSDATINAIGKQRGEDEDEGKEYHQHPPLVGGGANVNKSQAHKCPVECTCGRDNDQRWEVLCLRGNSYKSCCASILDGRYAIRVRPLDSGWMVVLSSGAASAYRLNDDGQEMYLLVNIRTCVWWALEKSN